MAEHDHDSFDSSLWRGRRPGRDVGFTSEEETLKLFAADIDIRTQLLQARLRGYLSRSHQSPFPFHGDLDGGRYPHTDLNGTDPRAEAEDPEIPANEKGTGSYDSSIIVRSADSSSAEEESFR